MVPANMIEDDRAIAIALGVMEQRMQRVESRFPTDCGGTSKCSVSAFGFAS